MHELSALRGTGKGVQRFHLCRSGPVPRVHDLNEQDLEALFTSCSRPCSRKFSCFITMLCHHVHFLFTFMFIRAPACSLVHLSLEMNNEHDAGYVNRKTYSQQSFLFRVGKKFIDFAETTTKFLGNIALLKSVPRKRHRLFDFDGLKTLYRPDRSTVLIV
jgi:hypothetical protein